ncbi:helix-turn-helix domain-containing protein [Microbacterium arborescens]|uniref:helix-turn-helix domain-containing protein n=1 Tax=Microbacterium arborescens TaxID=33883 RepID=UPI002789CCBF|nr:helix-turn-helix domain-containing protein [Microbacterium arborescens]MDQ1215707.1 transcriptional regulator with XRE-family HTH domain [Microbacterium arborescens]
MEIQATDMADETAERLAAEVRAEMARQRRTAGQLAQVLSLTQATVGRRLNGLVPFNITELAATAEWLGLSATELVERAQGGVRAVAS